MESKWSCKLTRNAEADLDSILRYLAVELANPNAAAAFADKLQAAMEEARTFPESGSLVINEYLPNTGVRKKVIGNYLMYYLPDPAEETVSVLRIVYGRRNIDEILQHLGI